MKKIIVEVACTKTLTVNDDTFKRLQEKNFSGHSCILKEIGADTLNIHRIDLSHKDNKVSKT